MRKAYVRVAKGTRRDGMCPRCPEEAPVAKATGRPYCRVHQAEAQRAYRDRRGQGRTLEERKVRASPVCPRCRIAAKGPKGYCGPCGAARLREWRRAKVKTPRTIRVQPPESVAEEVGAPSMAWLRRAG